MVKFASRSTFQSNPISCDVLQEGGRPPVPFTFYNRGYRYSSVLAMRALFNFITLSLICAHATAVARTLTSTVTIIPIPLETMTLQPTYRPYPIASGTGGSPKANSTLLSITLNYHTTTSTQTIFSAGATFSPRPNATQAIPPVNSSIVYNGTSIPYPFRDTCTPESILCDSQGSYSLCVPLLTDSTKYISAGPVPDGTICLDGSIDGKINGTCTPNGTLHCNVNGTAYFSCVEGASSLPFFSTSGFLTLLISCIGGLMIVGKVPSETMCLGATIVGY